MAQKAVQTTNFSAANRWIGVLLFFLVLAGCSHPNRIAAVPNNLTTEASVLELPNVRFWLDGDPAPLGREGRTAVQRELALLERSGHTGPPPPASGLVISGGGDRGAFGAGLLVGWTAAGNRPTFKLVTGISTGALIAPFAFLGPEYDEQLTSVYTEVSAEDIFEKRGALAVLFNDAMADTRPLWRLVERFVNEKMLRDIAGEYKK
ncbi:MAG: patatin family protein, partial [Deltaproteobacteria bacterium]|nr:patatin family protein [Deltaproteobacteria bacterium]